MVDYKGVRFLSPENIYNCLYKYGFHTLQSIIQGSFASIGTVSVLIKYGFRPNVFFLRRSIRA